MRPKIKKLLVLDLELGFVFEKCVVLQWADGQYASENILPP